MADSQTNININIDTSQALANLKALQSQISAFQTSMARGTATQAASAAKMRQNLINDINATKQFAASITNIQSTTESFTQALEKNKLSMGEYFRYAGGATKNFGKLFKSEMATIDKVARERVKTLQTQYIQLGRDASGAMKAIAVRPLMLDMDNLATKTAIAAQKQQILNQLLKQGATNMLNWGKNTQWAGRQLMVGFTIPLTMAGTAAAKAYMDIEKAAVKFKRVYGDLNTTAKETDNMVKSIQLLAQEYTKYGVAVADTMDMAAQAAAAGKTGADLLQQVSNATKLAVLGSVDQNQALETTISLTNAFGVAAQDLSANIDFLNSVENQTVLSIEDLTTAIPKAAPVVKQLGGDVKDLAFFMTAMKEGGINASEGANAIKSGLASMINPTKKASDFLMQFGVNVKGIVEADKGNIKQTVIDMAKAFDTLDPLNRSRAIEQMFGKFQYARISTLFQNVVKDGTQAQKVLELSNATSEELAILSQRELKKVSDSPMYKFQKSMEDLKVKLAPIGESFLKAVTPIINFVGKLLDGFNSMGEGAKTFWLNVTALAAGVGPVLLMTIGLLGNGVANLVKMFAGIKSFINKTTQETGNLGESTAYMTEAQLKASAAASSLDQIHQQLIQRFTSEAGAVDNLTQAYERNIAAQAIANGGSVNPTNIGRKYASGGFISGPGTGTSDSIPAMLSNGEAVIPAKSVAQNRGLVQGLISGNLPKFASGGFIDWNGEKINTSTMYTVPNDVWWNGENLGVPLDPQSAVVAFGAHQPFTTAHESIANFGKQMAKDTGKEFLQYSTAQGKSKRSLLSDELKKKLIKESIGVTPEIVANPFAMMESLAARGIKNVTLLLGEDRMSAGVFDVAAEKFGIKLEKMGIPRDPASPSGTKTRLAISNNDTKAYQNLIASGATQATKDAVFRQMQSRMNLPKFANGGIADVFKIFKNTPAEGFNFNPHEALGMTPGGFRNINGDKYYVKRGFSPAETASEVVISELYHAMGNKGARLNMFNKNVIGSKVIEGLIPTSSVAIGEWLSKQPNKAAAAKHLTKALSHYLKKDVPFNALIGNIDTHHENILFDPKTKKFVNLDLGSNVLAGFTNLPGYGATAAMDSSRIKSDIFPALYNNLDKKDVQKLLRQHGIVDAVDTTRGLHDDSAYVNKMAKLLGFDLSKTSRKSGQANPDNNKFIQQLFKRNPELVGMLDVKGRAYETSNKTFEESLQALFTRMKTAQKSPYHFYADGGFINGPGSGTSDSIPAMVSNGEAIIPAKNVRKFPNIVRGLIGGNLPRFADGGIVDQAMAKYQGKDPEAFKAAFERELGHILQTTGDTQKMLLDQLSKYVETSERVTARTMKDFMSRNAEMGRNLRRLYSPKSAAQGTDNFAHVRDAEQVSGQYVLDNATNLEPAHRDRLQRLVAQNPNFKVQAGSGLGFAQSTDLNLQMSRGKKSAKVEDILADFEPRGIAKWQQSVEIAGLKMEDVSKELKIYDDAIVAGLKNWQKLNPGVEMTQEEFANIERNVRQEIAPKIPVVGKAFGELADSLHDLRYTVGEQEFATTGLKRQTYRQFPKKGKKSATMAVTNIPISQIPVAVGNEFADEAAVQAQTASPSKRTRKVAKDTVDGYVGELEKGKKRVADIATKQTPPPPPPITPKPTGKDGYTGLGDVVRAKASGLFGTLKDKALGKVSSVLNRGREEAEKEHALAIERQQTAHELLKATDAEYAELDRRKQALVVKVNLTDAEQKEYQQLVALTSDKRNALSQDIAQNGIESDNIRQRIELAQQRGQAIDLEDVANLKQEKSNSRLAKLGNASGKMSGILMTASMVTGAMSMAGGQMGQLAQSIMPVISGMTMLQMVMQGMSLKGQLAAIGLAGIAVAAYGIFQFKNTVGAATDKMLDFNDSLGASAKAIQGLAEFSGKVTSSEVLDKRRQDQLNPYQIVTGKTTFGQNFVKSDTGTAMLKAIAGTSGSSDNFASAGTNLTSELATAVLSNAITAAQARSIAVNIGKKMGNVGIGIKVAGELSSLLGPNGENVLKDGLNIRIKLMQDTRNQVASANNSLNANGSMTGTESMNAWGSALGYGIAGGVASGLAVGTAVAAAGGSEIPVIGWIATAVATIGAGIYGFATASTTYAERIGKLAGAAVALQANALTQQKQLIDSLQMDYEKRIANAKAAGNVAEAERLQNEYLKQRQVLLQQNAKTMTEIQQGFKNSQHQDDLLSGMDKAITKKYKGTAMEDIAAGALSNLQTIQDKNKRYTLELLLNSTVDPMSMMFLTDLMAKDSSVIDKSINISTHLGGTGLNNVLGVAGLFTDANGKPNTKVQTDFIAKMSVVKDGGQADKLIQLYGELGKTNASDVSTTFMVKTVMADPALEARMAQDIEDIKSLPNGTLSYTIVQNAKIIDPKSLDIIKQDQDYFNHIKTNTEQRIYLEYAVMLSGTLTIDDPNFKAWLESEGSAWKDKPPLEALKQYEIYLTHQMTNRAMASGDNAFVSNKNTGTGTGPSASWLDDYVKAIRDLTDGSQKLTIGYDASSKALEKFAGKASSFKNAFKGMSNNLYASNISQDIIDNILGMPKDEADAQMKRFFDKNGKITKFLKDLQQTDAIQKVGNYYTSGLKANRNINDRVAAMGALARVNQNAGLAAEMMADADAVAALSSSKLVGSLADQKKAAEEVTKAFLKKAAEQRLSNSAEQNAINDAQANISVLEAQSAIYQNGLDIISAKAQKITDAYDKQIQALQDVKTVNDQITKQKQSQLDIADALSRGDIGAAAKAAEALRAQKAQDAADAQVKALEDAKKRAVDSLTVEINGQKMTKIELDQKVYDINLNVLNLKKDEVLQNELIIQKQKLQFANLVAQFAQTLKINAEKSKPVTQIQTIRVNRIVTTTNAGGGPTPPPGDTGQTPTPGQITPSGAVTTAELSKGVAAFQRRQTGTTGNRFITGGASNQSAQSLSIDVVKALYNKQKTAFSNGFDLWTNSNTITDLAKRNKFQSELAAFKNTQEYKEAHALGLDTASWKDSYLSQNIQVMSTTAEAFSKVANAATNYGYSILPASIKTRIDWLIQAAQDFNTDKTNYDTLRAKVQGAKDKVGAGSIPITTLYSEYAKAKDADKPKTAFGQMISKSLLTQEDVQAFMDAWNKIKNTAALSFQYKKDLVSRGYDSSTGTLHQFFSDHGVYLPSDIASRNREEIGYHAGVFNPEWVQRYAKGGVVKPKYFSVGNLAVGTDTVPAMLTPGEFVVNQAAVKNFGTDNLKAINSGTYSGDSVYNYSVNVNVANTGANPNDIARTVIAEIKRIDGQRVRGNSL